MNYDGRIYRYVSLYIPLLLLTEQGRQVTAGNPAIARPFAIMQLVGGTLLLITLVTAILAKDVKRNLSWISFCSAGIFSCVAYDLLFFVGQQTGPPPDRGLCLVQSALVHAVPVMWV